MTDKVRRSRISKMMRRRKRNIIMRRMRKEK